MEDLEEKLERYKSNCNDNAVVDMPALLSISVIVSVSEQFIEFDENNSGDIGVYVCV